VEIRTMSQQNSRYTASHPIHLAEGWSLDRLTPKSQLFGANGLRTGPDGRIYVAQVVGSQISALDVETGQVTPISPKGGDIIAPDDVAFDPRGNLYATEVMDGRVSVLGVDGRARVLRDDVPCANGITVHQGRLFVGELRVGGRLLELDLNGGAPRVLLDNVPMPNAMEVGPDGLLYYPVMATNEIWRIHPDGGTPERVAADLGVPDAVKFDAEGHIVSTQVHSGQVLRINPQNGERSVLASLAPGLDNLTFLGDRLFVSNLTGEITEVMADGRTRTAVPLGLNWPLDLTVDDGGMLYVADGTSLYALGPAGKLQSVGTLFGPPGYPGVIRGLTSIGAGALLVTTTNGQVTRYLPAKSESEVMAAGLDQPYGVAVASDGAVVVAELGAGRVVSIRAGKVEVLASRLRDPLGVAFDSNGACFVSEAGAGRVGRLTASGIETILDGLERPQGILVRDGQLFVVDAAAKSLVGCDLDGKARHTIARNLPVGAPPGVTAKPLRGVPPFSGPQGPFAGIAAGPDGTLYISADAEGSLLALRRSN
jgi:sugar lactone lactonase YvrE